MKMNLTENLLLHRKIVTTFDYNPYLDFLSGLLLSTLIKNDLWEELPIQEVVSVIGPRDSTVKPEGYVIVADSALDHYEGRYDMIVSDLDGPVDKIIKNVESVKVIHAHGDNMDRLRSAVPLLKGKILGTTQSIPIKNIRNIGGFTDGDRSVLLARLMGAKRIYIHGFDYSNPVDEPKVMKVRKLQFAKEIIDKIKDVELLYV